MREGHWCVVFAWFALLNHEWCGLTGEDNVFGSQGIESVLHGLGRVESNESESFARFEHDVSHLAIGRECSQQLLCRCVVRKGSGINRAFLV